MKRNHTLRRAASGKSLESLHICHVTTAHPWDDTRIFLRMCCGLAEKGLRVSLVAPIDKEQTIEKVRVVPTGLRGKARRLFGAPVLLWKLIRLKCDIYHFHDPELLPWMFLLQKLMPSSAVIYDVHEYYPDRLIEFNYLGHPLLNCILSRLVLHLEPFLGRRLRGVIGVVEPISRRFEGGQARVAVVRNLVKLSALPPYAATPERLEHPLLVLGGTVNASRCMSELLESLSLLKKKSRVVRLECFGEPEPAEYAEQLRSQAQRLAIADQVSFLSKTPFKVYQQHLAKTCMGLVIFLPNPRYQMAGPNRLFEFMAHGVPIVANNFPGVGQIIEDAKCGLLIDATQPSKLADAIEYFLDNREQARQMGANGRRAVEDRYSWERELDRLVDFYLGLPGIVPIAPSPREGGFPTKNMSN